LTSSATICFLKRSLLHGAVCLLVTVGPSVSKCCMKLRSLTAFLIIIHEGEAVLQNRYNNWQKDIVIGTQILYRSVLLCCIFSCIYFFQYIVCVDTLYVNYLRSTMCFGFSDVFRHAHSLLAALLNLYTGQRLQCSQQWIYITEDGRKAEICSR
jgi:hypothetical protein